MSLSRTIPVNGLASRVSFAVSVDGTEVPHTVNLMHITVYREANRIARATLFIMDGNAAAADFPVSNGDTFLPGKEITVQLGYNNANEKVFIGVIVKHSIKVRTSGSPLLCIECMDKLAKLSISKKNKYFADMKDSEVIEEMVNNAGLISDVEATDVKHKELVQYYATDWDFIMTRAEANGKLCFTDDGVLVIKRPDLSQEPAFDLLFGSTILELDAEIDARHQVMSVTTSSWDPASQSLITAAAEEPGFPEQGNINSEDLAAVFQADPYALQHGGALPESELQAWADAQLMKFRLSKIRGRVRFQGFAGIMPGQVVNLGGIGERFNGKVYVSGVRHEVKNGAWHTDVQFGLSPDWFAERHAVTQPAASALLPGVQGLHIGVVTDLEDPDGAFRVKVKLPEIAVQEEGTWARIASFYAGNERSSFFRPEIGDEVIVGFLHNDPNHPVVLGAVHSAANASPEAHSNDNYIKRIVTASNLELIFNDDKRSVTVQTPAGKVITVDEDAGMIKLEDEYGNKVTMEQSAVKLEAVANLELKAGAELKIAAPNVSVKADAACELNGSASMKVASSGTCVVQGALVQIN
ncbi:type VI secretion system tip protein VgrG [Chitinophaga horti]|uniref:Type VI secretion system tip protein VgrG n=1 Tax=Chitinophaga horti TaxID=2920382 RepID=A0ABY6J5T0_9BACT|nr:type VI secretion system tip protein VgrG [Chitinophaga horti]UYQ93534.1 type VI secretion system tip protein VgrG [Chitinophaga horti]